MAVTRGIANCVSLTLTGARMIARSLTLTLTLALALTITRTLTRTRTITLVRALL